jgi:hypothetical protein
MRYYQINFTDGTDTIGKQVNKAAMRKDANLYCRQWQLEERVESIIEITEEEYNSRLR